MEEIRNEARAQSKMTSNNNNSNYNNNNNNNNNYNNKRRYNNNNRYNNTNSRYNNNNRYSNNRHNDNKSNQKSKFPAPKKNNIFDLSKYLNKKLIVRLPRQRQVTGELKGFDPLMSLVLQDAEETSQAMEGFAQNDMPKTRNLGTVIIRGRTIVTISPFDGSEIIDNPFLEITEEA